MTEDRRLHFSLGPVQGFVAQARKTRDFWAGSFLLSYLAGQAMYTVLKAGGKMELPSVGSLDEVTDPLLVAISQRENGKIISDRPLIATLPNRFQARIPAGFDPDECVKAVNKAWHNLAEAVWRRYVAPVADKGQGTRKIWERQVKNFWEINWVIGEDSALLDRRKNWRSHVPPEEPGDKCTLMGNLQELSGFIRSQEREKQDAFWAALRKIAGEHELDEKERLSAIALIKRLFPLVAEEAIGWKLSECERYPSTPYLAAVPWLAKAIASYPHEVREYYTLAAGLSEAKNREDPARFPCLQDALKQYPEAQEFAALDGNCFFTAALANPRLWQGNRKKEGDTETLRRELLKNLENLNKKIGSPASPFYALLLMDGDRMGRLLRLYDCSKVSQALSFFSRRVPQIIKGHNGVTVYAGGDDVLALLPLDRALKAAVALRLEYSKSFINVEVPEREATISGAIIYAHYNTPLTGVIREAHRLLDDVAKSETGRDSLAVTVWKGAGRVLTWAAPWKKIIKEENFNIIDEMVSTFVTDDPREREYNHTFFHNLRTRFKVLADAKGNIPWTESDLVDLFAAEYRKNREREVDWLTARQRMERLLQICYCFRRDEEGEIHRVEGVLNLDGVLLVKFLAQKGVV